MILFRKPLVFYIGGNFLEAFETNSHKQQRFSFSSSSIQHSEIVDEKKYSGELQKFIEELKLKKGKGIILLSYALVYAKDIDIAGKNEKDEIEKFLAAVPLSRSSIAMITLHGKNKLRILAANRKLYERVLEVLKKNNIEILSVSPVSVFTNSTNGQGLTAQEARKITGKKRILQRYNFLLSKQQLKVNKDSDQIDPILEEEERKGMKKQLIFLVLSLLLLTSTIGYLLLWSEIIANPWFKKPQSLNQKPTAATSPSVTPHPKPTTNPLTDKSAIKIEILNGSGVEGQAGKLSDLLKGAGYKNISTGNTSNLEQRTTITYNKLIPKDVLAGITDAMKSDFPDPTLQEASQSGEFDVVITTGTF